MHLLRAVAARVALPVCIALSALAGCSSSTEPKSNITPDGLAVSLTLDTTAQVVGDWITTTMAIQNTTSEDVSRTFPPNDWGPIPQSSDSNLEEDGFDGSFLGQFLVADEPHTLTVGAHQTITHIFHFRAMHVGWADISACIPDSDAGKRPATCVTKAARVTSN